MTNPEVKEAAETRKQAGRSGRLKRWGREALVMILLFIVVSTGIDLWRGREMPSGTMPEMVVQDLNGELFDVKAMSYQQPVLLYFWATWCSACRFVSPVVNWISRDYSVMSVAVSSGDSQRVSGWLSHHGYRFPVTNDSKGEVAKSWGVSATPTLVIVKDGQVVSTTTGITTPPGIWLRMLFAG